MTIAEYNKRMDYIKTLKLEVQKFLLPRVKETGFWLVIKAIKDG